ncbi:transcription termination/antitermination NusG family protein [Thermoanaerobacter sp. YS13]|nr:transcription termination/antitermination NusG family protein [Thermoanaerobacter sp. YS13]
MVKRKLLRERFFPGYVLVKMVMTDDTWYVCAKYQGCYRICRSWV